jgi:LacI family transcriptional regulator
MAGSKRVTIDRVAQVAGVSAQTVSRVLNNRPDVSAETRARIKEIMRELGYQPSAIAQSLASQRTRTLGLITADFSDYFFTQVIVGAEQESRQHGYLFMLGSTALNPQNEPEYIRLFSEQHVAGFLFARASTASGSREFFDLSQSGIPIVIVPNDYHVSGLSLTVVDVDNVMGGRLAARYLLDGGHRRIAMIKGPRRWKSVDDRSEGFRLELEADGLQVTDQLVGEGDWSYASGYRATMQLLDSGDPFTAVFVQNDQMAIGAMRALREAGRHIPDDVAMVGYDDVPAAEYADPPLTTIRQPTCEVGKLAARLLIQRIEKEDQPDEMVLLEPELVRRET